MMQLFNTLTGRLEPLATNKEIITIYVCGITPYDTTHLGHCFNYSSYDILIRHLESEGYRVRYAQNVTDIDDDILKRAKELDEDWWELGNRWTIRFIDDNQELNIRPPDYFPRATDVISEIIDAVESLLSAGVAYISAGNVYFHVADDPDYGKLSKLKYSEMLPIANERGNNPDDPNKRDPLDFVLWQARAEGEPAWESPWGWGRPGWHIECSTMASHFLDLPVDIHGGGEDLVFPHHESEIAQSECATADQTFASRWMHVSMLRYEGEKMSKSLGNLVMVSELRERGWSTDTLRLCMAMHHYREEWNYQERDLDRARFLTGKFMHALSLPGGSGQALNCDETAASFRRALNNDLNSPQAVSILEQLADDIVESDENSKDVENAKRVLRERCAILGLSLGDGEMRAKVRAGWENHRSRFTE